MPSKTLNTLLASAVALTIAGAAGSATAANDSGKEKCYGVVKAGHNDCGSADKAHSCMGQATVDGNGQEWVAVPEGLCEKLVGGSLQPYEGTKLHDEDHGDHDQSEEG